MLTRTEGIVLRNTPYGEADLIVTFFTRDEGLVQGFAKSSRKVRSRFGAALEPLSRVRISLMGREGGSLPRITQADIVESFHVLREDLPTLVSLGPLVDLVRTLLHEREPHARKYDLLVAGFRALGQASSRPVILLCLMIKFLWMCGYGPRVSACGRCGAVFSGGYGYFFPEYGAVLCQACRSEGFGRALRIGRDTVRFFSEARSGTFGELLGYFPAEEVLREARNLIEGHSAHMCGGRCRPPLDLPAVPALVRETQE